MTDVTPDRTQALTQPTAYHVHIERVIVPAGTFVDRALREHLEQAIEAALAPRLGAREPAAAQHPALAIAVAAQVARASTVAMRAEVNGR